MRKIFVARLSFLILTIVFNFLPVAAQTSAFTYQGKLTDGSAAANGQYDFKFRLFTDATGDDQVGEQILFDNVQVTGGMFTVTLDFGPVFSANQDLFLEIQVRPGASTGAYTLLAPRQRVMNAPFSIKSESANSANALSSLCALCVTNAQIQSIDGGKVTGTVANAGTATNVSGIVPITNGGTGSSTKNFVDLSTNQTNIFGNKTFRDSTTFNGDATFNNINPVNVNGALNVGGVLTADQFLGDGAGLTNVHATLRWLTVSGVTQQAQRNTGYLTNNAAQVTVTLPDSANLNIGDVVRVSGMGAGGWKIAQNAGQSIIGTNINVMGWTPRESNRFWSSVASSADGSKLVAVCNGDNIPFNGGQIYTSTDSGVTWTPRESDRRWSSVASSADGTKLVAVDDGGQIYTSTDSGVSWMPRESDREWASVASSADGTRLVAGVRRGGQIYTSVDSGVMWTARESNRNWQSVASSADGSKLVAIAYDANLSSYILFTSVNSGVNWTPRESIRGWYSVASSADGTKLVSVVYNGQIYISVDSGVTWTPRESNRAWRSVASSADGTKLVAVDDGGQIYTSVNSGVTWTQQESNRNWSSVASSADGTKLVAVVNGGKIYTSSSATTVGTAGFLTGSQFSAIELQYIGSGQFIPISYVGAISGN